MSQLPVSVYFGAFAVAAALPILWWAVSTTRSPVDAQQRLSVRRPNDLRDIVLSRSASERVVQPGLGWMSQLGRTLTPPAFLDRLERKISLAGMGRTWPIERVLGIKFLLGAGFGTLMILRWASQPNDVRLFLFAAFFAVGAFVLPDLMIGIKGHSRQEEIGRSLPDVLDQITIAVEAGLGFEAALAHVAGHLDSPLGEELGHTLQDIRVGMSRRRAFDNLNARTDVPDLRHFVSALQQAERLGVPIAQVLRTQSAELRVIRRQNAEETAQKLPVKMIIPLVVFILPALVIVVLAPAVFDAMDAFGS